MDTQKNDLQLILSNVRSGDEKSFDILYQQYKPLITSKVAEFIGSLEAEEIEQLSSIALYDAAMSYDYEKVDRKVTFGLYADICIRNKLISELRRVKAVEIPDGDIVHSEESGSGASPEEYVLRKEDVLSRIRRAKSMLTPFENTVFLLYLSGDGYNEIAAKLGKSRKSVDNALTRIRTKFKSDNMPE